MNSHTLDLRVAGYQPPRSVHSRAMRVLERQLKSALGDGLSFGFTENVADTGRKAGDLFAMTEGEELDLCYFSSSYLAGRVPALGVLDLPFQFSDRRNAYRLLDGPLGRRLADEVAAKTGFLVLGFWDNGFRHISNWRNAIRRPEDCSGLTIRTLDNEMYKRVLGSIGFNPVFIDVRDLGAAVAERRVDAQENPLTNMINFDLHKHHRHLSLTSHFFGAALVLANRARFERWPPEVRAAIEAGMGEATRAQRTFAAEEDETCLKSLAEAGVEITRGEAIDRAAFQAAAAPVVDEARAKLGDELVRLAAQ